MPANSKFAKLSKNDVIIIGDKLSFLFKCKDAWVGKEKLEKSYNDLLCFVKGYADNIESIQGEEYLGYCQALSRNATNIDDKYNCTLGLHFWATIHDISLVSLDINNAHRCREKFNSIIDKHLLSDENIEEVSVSDGFILKLGRAMELKEDQAYNHLLKMYDELSRNEQSQVRPAIRALHLAFGKVDRYQRTSQVTLRQEVDREFSDYVNGKSVAIVGPSITALDYGKEIDAHDIVIRFNHNRKNKYDVLKQGGRTDISYYTNPAFQKLVLIEKDSLTGLSYAIPQNVSELQNQYDLSLMECDFRSQYRSSNAIFLKSHGNALQRLLLDLLRFPVGNVSVYNMDMWLTPHDGNYLAGNTTITPHAFIHHDLTTNFLFTKNLFASGVIRADKTLASVLSMSLVQYLKSLHEKYFKGESKNGKKVEHVSAPLESRILKSGIERRLKVKIVGDHSRTHCGCQAVMSYIHNLLSSKFDITDNEADYDVLLVNGEGSMHHNSVNFKNKMEAIARAVEANKPVRLVNSVWEKNGKQYDGLLKEIKNISVREAASQRDLFSRHGISSIVRIDCSYFSSVDDKSRYTDLKGKMSFTDFYSKDFGGWVKYSGGSRSKYPYLDMKSFSWSEFVNTLKTSELLVSGRHHAIFAACAARTPFVAVESNTHKISGFVNMAQLPIPICENPRELGKAIEWAKKNPSVYDEFFNFLDEQPALSLTDLEL